MTIKKTDRKAFSFYQSYYDTFNILENDTDKVSFIKALLDRQFLGVEPTNLIGAAELAYVGQRYSIDTQVNGYEDKMKSLHPTTPPYQQEKEKEKEEVKEKEKEKEKEQEQEEEKEKEREFEREKKKEKEKEIKIDCFTSSTFPIYGTIVPPTIEKVTQYFDEKFNCYSDNKANEFFNEYESNGWTTGGKPITNWFIVAEIFLKSK